MIAGDVVGAVALVAVLVAVVVATPTAVATTAAPITAFLSGVGGRVHHYERVPDQEMASLELKRDYPIDIPSYDQTRLRNSYTHPSGDDL